jgi:hypothetical protein
MRIFKPDLISLISSALGTTIRRVEIIQLLRSPFC